MASSDEADKDDIADALERLADGKPDRPPRPLRPGMPSEFRRPTRATDEPAAPTTPPKPPPAAKARPARPRPDRPDRPAAPSTPEESSAASAEPAEYDPMSSIVDDDDVIVPAPDPEVFAPHAPPAPTQIATGPTGIRSLTFRRTAIPILLTCGVLLIGIGLLRWLGGIDSIFADMSIPLSATLCGTGFFLLLVAMLNMLQVRSELAAAAKRGS